MFRSIRYLWHGFQCLLQGKLQVEFLDAVSIGVSIVRGDYYTAATVMFLLHLRELLDEWTHKKSVGDLARSCVFSVENHSFGRYN